jgi:hypothetical protein
MSREGTRCYIVHATSAIRGRTRRFFRRCQQRMQEVGVSIQSLQQTRFNDMEVSQVPYKNQDKDRTGKRSGDRRSRHVHTSFGRFHFSMCNDLWRSFSGQTNRV